jgi:MoaA/NifB/PqqE/SkfB family radical SAM enzyme
MAIRDVFDILVRNEFSTASIQQELGEHYPKDREDWLRHEIKVHEGQKRQITGCHHTAQDGGRIYGALHIAPTGELFLCCEDYTMAHRFGNLLEQSFDEIWHSEAHVDAILKSQQSTCQECQHRIEIRN